MTSQSSITAGALTVAYLIFITVRGELPAYFGVLGIGRAAISGPKTQPAGFGIASSLTALAGGGGTQQSSTTVVVSGGGGGGPSNPFPPFPGGGPGGPPDCFDYCDCNPWDEWCM